MIFDDSKSDNTDDLLTTIEPMLMQSDLYTHENKFKSKMRHISEQPESLRCVKNVNNDIHNNNVILEDILSARSSQQNQVKLSRNNLVHYGEDIDSDRSVSTRQWANSVTPQSSSRTDTVTTSQDTIKYEDMSRDLLIDKIYELTRELEKTRRSWNLSRIEIQRLQLTTKQLSTQLKESKLSIQTLSIQLDQTQKECLHKESTLKNLDNTIGKLVCGWKKRENQRDDEIENLKHILTSRNKELEECHQISEETKKALSNADKSVTKEKNRCEQMEKNFILEIDNLKRDKDRLVDERHILDNEMKILKEELKKTKEQLNNSVRENNSTEKQYLEKNDEWKNKYNSMVKDFDNLKRDNFELEQEIENQNERIIRAKEELMSWEDETEKWRKNGQEKEQEVIRLKNKLIEVENIAEAQTRRLEKNLQSKYDEDLKAIMTKSELKQNKSIHNLQFQFQQKLNDQSQRHKLELDRLRQVAEKEILARVTDAEETIKMLRERLARTEKSVSFWQQEKESVERARNQLSATLYQSVSDHNQYYLTDNKHNITPHQQVTARSCETDLEDHKSLSSSKNSHSNATFRLYDNKEGFLPVSKFQENYFEPIKNESVETLVTAKNDYINNLKPIMSQSKISSLNNYSAQSTKLSQNKTFSAGLDLQSYY